jgi:imidazolonepropionase-like amidohydrolase
VLILCASVGQRRRRNCPDDAGGSGARHQGRTLDRLSHRWVLRNQAILIGGAYIKEVGPAATVLPGLIDVHVHLLQNWKDHSVAADLRMSSARGAL